VALDPAASDASDNVFSVFLHTAQGANFFVGPPPPLHFQVINPSLHPFRTPPPSFPIPTLTYPSLSRIDLAQEEKVIEGIPNTFMEIPG
jgi:hypothetical protein